MNERIKEFRFKAAEYANEQKPLGLMKWNEIRDAKFASLLIGEICQHLINVGQDHARELVEKHFGVE